MKKTHLLLITILFLTGNLYSQDKLININNDTLVVKVIEITPKEIKYRSSDNPDGPLITVNKNEYISILYANGTTQTIQDLKTIKKRIVYKNSININFMSFLTNEVEVNYERLLKGNMIGIQVPLRFGYKNNNLIPYTRYNRNRDYNYYSSYYNTYDNNLDFSFSTGAFIKFYYNKPAIVRGYSGIELIGTILKSTSNISYYDDYGNYTDLGSFKNYQGVLGFMAITGFKVTPYPRVTFSLDGGGGYGGIFNKATKYTIGGTEYKSNKSKNGTGIWKVSASIGINF